MRNGGSGLGDLSLGLLLQGFEGMDCSTSSYKGPGVGGIIWHAAFLLIMRRSWLVLLPCLHGLLGSSDPNSELNHAHTSLVPIIICSFVLSCGLYFLKSSCFGVSIFLYFFNYQFADCFLMINGLESLKD